jgi:GNAT superfamily N-acetyltransferase
MAMVKTRFTGSFYTGSIIKSHTIASRFRTPGVFPLSSTVRLHGMTDCATFQIRDGRPGDAAIIAAYNSAMARETEGRGLDPGVIGPGVEALLQDERKGRYWVAECNGKVIGQLMVTYEWSDWRNGMIWWIQSVYVAPEWRRKGVFSALFHHVKSLVEVTPKAVGLRLYVEESNTRAQGTYAALGMAKPNYIVMEAMLKRTKSTDRRN